MRTKTKRKPSVDDLVAKGYAHFAIRQADTAVFEAARAARRLAHPTFFAWLTIAHAIAAARSRDEGSPSVILEREGIKIDRATISRLEAIWQHLPEVVSWFCSLPPEQQARKSAPTTIIESCPALWQPAKA